MRLLDVLRGSTERTPEGRSLSLDEWAQWFTFNGVQYPFGQTLQGGRESIDGAYQGYVNQAYKGNGVVFACEALRMRVFAEARFAWQRREQGRGQRPFTDAALAPLERPWPGGTTQDLLMRMLVSADLAGNAFVTRNRLGHLRVLRPDWVTILRGSQQDPDEDPDGIDATLLGYAYQRGGPTADGPIDFLGPDDVAHFAPEPDPLAMFRGMSWLTPVLREVRGDSGMSDHKLKFLENGATPNIIVKLDPQVTPAQFGEFKEKMEAQYAGVGNAYKTMYLGGGADATVVGSDLAQMDFKSVQGHGETRIAMAAGVHPVVVGMSEGLEGSSLNAGNYGQARRNVADTTFHPLWRNAAGSLERIVPRRLGRNNQGADLIADTRDVPFLREDAEQVAKIQQQKASTITGLIREGFTAESVVQAVMAEDFNQLEHSGRVSVQLQEPGADGGDE